jgi:ankyrin repeat protein
LVAAGATIDPFQSDDGNTPLANAIGKGHIRCAEILFDAGAKMSQLKVAIPEWMKVVVLKRDNCKKAFIALYGALRKRLFTQVSKDMAVMISMLVWHSRRSSGWVRRET